MRTIGTTFLALTLAASLGAQQATTRLTGIVLSSLSGDPLPGVLVSVPGQSSRTTDSAGRFDFPSLPLAKVKMRFGHGEKSSPDQVLDLSTAKKPRIEVLLDSTAADLAPDVVPADRLDNQLGLAGFFERRRLGFGRFFTRADLVRTHLHTVDEALLQVGAMYRCSSRGCGPVLLAGARECPMTVLMDGYPAVTENLAAMSLDEVAGLEVYRPRYDIGSGVTLSTGSSLSALARRCGLLVIWTRDATVAAG
jgi:hypothetical protein